MIERATPKQRATTTYYERTRDLIQRIGLKFLPARDAERYRAAIRADAFVIIEKERRWGAVSASGPGSTIDKTTIARTIIVDVIKHYSVTSMLDVPCGDFAWMPLVLQELPADFRYLGVDIVPALIARNASVAPNLEFKVLDFVSDKLPRCDLILCRDALQHLPVAAIKKALRNFSLSGAKYLLASTHMRRFGWKNGRECRVGKCRDRNLILPPFNLPDPIALFSERDENHKFLGLWKLPFQTDVVGDL